MKFDVFPYFTNIHLTLESLIQTRNKIPTFEMMARGPIWPPLSLPLIILMALMLLAHPLHTCLTYFGVLNDAPSSSVAL